jgi:error-prone DNA polymerase
LGLRLVKGISPDAVAGIENARRDGPFRSVAELARRSGAARSVLARLAAADVFRSMGLDRRQALWDVLALHDEPPLLASLEPDEPPPALPAMPLAEQVVSDYDATGLSLTAHPVSLMRAELRRSGVIPADRLPWRQAGDPVRVAGLVLVRQRPGTASGIVFATLEDETGVSNLIIRPKVFERFRKVVSEVMWLADGRIERTGDVIHVQVSCLRSVRDMPADIRVASRDYH